MRILVTGSSGFIGARLVSLLAEAGHEVGRLDRREPPAVQPGRFFHADLCALPAVKAALRDFAPESLIHLAAETGLDERQGLAGYAANIEGVANLIEAIRGGGTVRRAVFTSSQLVCRIGYTPRHDLDFAPHTLYGESKVLTERLVRAADGGCGIWCLVRPTTVWGPGMSPHYQRFFRLLQRGWYFHTGTRPLMKSYAFIGNIVHQYKALLEANAERVHRRVFYLADYEPLSLRAWTESIAKALGAPPIRTIPEPAARLLAGCGDLLLRCGVRGFPFNSFRLANILAEYVYDLEPTRDVCGRIPFSMEAGVQQTAEWIRTLDK